GEVVRSIAAGGPATIDGAWGSACALTVAALAQSLEIQGPGVVICQDDKSADLLADDLDLWLPDRSLRFPAWESDPGERLIYDEIYADRLRTLKHLMSDSSPMLIVTSIASQLQPVPPRAAVEENTRRVCVGDEVDFDQLATWLTQHGFHATSAVELPGEFALRGGILDIFGPEWNAPARLELFGDQIDSIRQFDVSSQRSLQPLRSIDVTILPSGGNDPMRAAGERTPFTAYLPGNSWIAICEPEAVDASARHYLQTHEQVARLMGLTETWQRVGQFGHVHISGLARGEHQASFRLPVESVQRYSGTLDHIRDELQHARGISQALVICPTEAESKRLAEVLAETDLAKAGQLQFASGRLATGFCWLPESMLVLSGPEMFHRTELRRKQRRRLGKRIDTFLELRPGDLVVHLSHGVGRYRGMEVLTRENQVEDHLVIEFAMGTKVYVPATKIDLVQKYVGSGKARPRLAKIGGTGWSRRKKDAELAVSDMAVELLEVQAQRRALPGIAFAADTEWQREFDASFPYDETEDQLYAIDAIKSDMEQPRPMDRLLCGDVGFGKTEMAMRAAFKA
ncbi:MAG: transcription-repair coupling factor, partial [Planctomycetales bacterium]|nr:transcription-repair coupling factor [Planctomycetales bacterium]